MKPVSKEEANYLHQNGCGQFVKHTLGKSKKKTYYAVECKEVLKVLKEYCTNVIRVVYDSGNKGVKIFGDRK